MLSFKEKIAQIKEYRRLKHEHKVIVRNANDLFFAWVRTWRPIEKEYSLDAPLSIEESNEYFGLPGYSCIVRKVGNEKYRFGFLTHIDSKEFRCPNFSAREVCKNTACRFHHENQKFITAGGDLDKVLKEGKKIESELHYARMHMLGREK